MVRTDPLKYVAAAGAAVTVVPAGATGTTVGARHRTTAGAMHGTTTGSVVGATARDDGYT